MTPVVDFAPSNDPWRETHDGDAQVTSILVEAVAAQMLAVAEGEKLPSLLKRAIASAPASSYRGGQKALLADLHAHLASLHAAATDETQRVRLVAAMCVVQDAIADQHD